MHNYDFEEKHQSQSSEVFIEKSWDPGTDVAANMPDMTLDKHTAR